MNDKRKFLPDVPDSLKSLASMKRISDTLGPSEHVLKMIRQQEELIKRLPALTFPGDLLRQTSQMEETAKMVSALTKATNVPAPDPRTKMALRAIEDFSKNSSLSFASDLTLPGAAIPDSLSRKWFDIYNSQAFSTVKILQKEHGEELSLLIKNVGRLSDFLPSSFISKHIPAGSLDIKALAEWDKLTHISMSALNKRQQEMAFSAVSGLISEHSEYFSAITAAILRTNHEESADQSADTPEDGPDAGRLFSQMPAWMQWIIVGLLTHFLFPTLQAIWDDIALGYLKEQCFTSYFCENKNQQASILTANKPDELSYRDLNRFRVVTKENVRLRSAPSMKGEIIEVLPLHQPLLIINRDNRSWLLIRTQINGEDVEGWVNRAYTRAIMK